MNWVYIQIKVDNEQSELINRLRVTARGTVSRAELCRQLVTDGIERLRRETAVEDGAEVQEGRSCET